MYPPPSLSLRGNPPGQGKKLPKKVTSPALVICRMVGKDGTGKGRITYKVLRLNGAVSKSCLNMFIFSMLIYSLKASPFGQKASFKMLLLL